MTTRTLALSRLQGPAQQASKASAWCRVLKLLSEDPANYSDAPREGIRRVLEEVTGRPHPRQEPLDTSRIASIRMGTTVRADALPASPWAGAALSAATLTNNFGCPGSAAPCVAKHTLISEPVTSRSPPTRCWSARASAARW